MAVTRKRSKQRDAIMANLAPRKDHPTAYMVYEDLRRELPNISLGTVYRNLSLLAEQGEILKISCNGNMDRFDPTTIPHYHFHCTKCDCVTDIELELTVDLNQPKAKDFHGEIESHTLFFSGICENCISE